jgi:hypothetical protein
MKKDYLTENEAFVIPKKPMADAPKPPKFKGLVNETLRECKEKIDQYLEDSVDRAWKIGEQLLRAKEAIIKAKKDKRAPGFIGWAKFHFGFSKSTVSRLIKAHENQIRDIGVIWGNRPLSEDGSDPSTQPIKANYTNEWRHYQVEFRTRNRSVISFMAKIQNMEQTEIDNLEGVSESDLHPNLCIVCHAEVNKRNRTGLCKDCYQKAMKKGPDVDSRLTLSERVHVWIEKNTPEARFRQEPHIPADADDKLFRY